MIELRYLSRADALRVGAGDWQHALDDVRATTRLLRDGNAGMVAESVMPVGTDPRDNAYGLPAFVAGDYDAAGLKWAMHRAAPARDLPSITSTTFINRYSDGRPIGLVESALLTRMRTAAVSAIAMQSLVAQPVRSIAVLGAGAQARAHIDMVQALFPAVETVRVWNRTIGHRDAMLAGIETRAGLRILSADTINDALDGVQVILCCTTSPQPLLSPDHIQPGRLIVQVGYNEISFEAIDAANHIVVDLWGEFAEKSAKSLFQMYRAGRFAADGVSADLAGLVVDGWKPSSAASVIFSSFGLNVFDIAMAARVLKQAERDGIGTLLPFL
ncbi:ornithine cyclodeaminase family protein [Mesorhizobium sp. YR577]|uniref:ornithine cyclodeaminase family protein n=1 Tax=Mesorhizobium sp. YR577 TaxID=1884373 RepID=UPI0008ED4337|nr:ornithine cyclodeaminase family protein [Mesorhizobium sp. YR577]SFU21177.1 ornithine cyclodeaminase [Mesorhizobium sp. YR577]